MKPAITQKNIDQIIYKLRGVDIKIQDHTHGFIVFNTLCILSPKINAMIDSHKEIDEVLMKLIQKKLIVDEYISTLECSMLEEGLFQCSFPKTYL